MSRKQEIIDQYGNDAALSITSDSDVQTCYDYATLILDREGAGRVLHLQPAGTEAAGGIEHQFVVLDERYVVDPWVVEWAHIALRTYQPVSVRSVFDLHDPADQSEVLRLYGHPNSWTDDEDQPAGFELPDFWSRP